MSTYYEYQDVKLMIAHRLMEMDGWEVYGYSPDRSDSMTDYYEPEYWGGVASKNGYVLCVDVYGEAKPEEIREYNYDAFTYDAGIMEKINKLEQMTVERGASEQEEASAKASIARLQEKARQSDENKNRYKVVGIIPGHMAHPPRANWHIEKDGIVIAKGNGILKFAEVEEYYHYPHYKEDMSDFQTMDREEYRKKLQEKYVQRQGLSEERAARCTDEHIKSMEKSAKLVGQFEEFIRKIDSTCGGMIGEGDNFVYEKVMVTEYKTKLVPVETKTGEVREGQLFILKSNFNYGCYKGLIYRIHETEYNGHKYYHAYKLNRKHDKECTGRADSSNYWACFGDKFMGWIEKGAIAWCELQEVKEPYQVEKVVKKRIGEPVKSKAKESSKAPVDSDTVFSYTFEIEESEHTKTHEPIWLARVTDSLSREEFAKVRDYIKSLNGYYSKFTHSFVFSYDPTNELLKEE